MPIYCALDGQQQRKCTAEQVIQHENLWGTSWYPIKREFYKICSDEINKRLHAGKQSMFEKYQMVFLNPTPRWEFEDIHVCRKSGLPLPEFHNLMIRNFLFCISRAVCDQKFCTIGVNSSRSKRETNSLLYHFIRNYIKGEINNIVYWLLITITVTPTQAEISRLRMRSSIMET